MQTTLNKQCTGEGKKTSGQQSTGKNIPCGALSLGGLLERVATLREQVFFYGEVEGLGQWRAQAPGYTVSLSTLGCAVRLMGFIPPLAFFYFPAM